MYVYYCPICGGINRKDKSTYTCKDCQSTVPDTKSEHQIDYYEQKSVTLYDTSKFWDYLLLEEEIKKNPMFDASKIPPLIASKLDRQSKEIRQIVEIQNSRKNNLGMSYNPQNLPNCPSCGSANVRKAFDINRANRIAPSAFVGAMMPESVQQQYECENCGLKF